MSAKAMLDAIWTRLQASTVYTTVGGRIGLSELPANTALPLVVYDFESAPTCEKLFGSVERFEGILVFRIYQSAAAGNTLHTVSADLLTAMSATISPTGFDRLTAVRISVGSPSFEDDGWTMVDRYRVVGYRTS